jgi:DNA-binding beta-propeller fold protein YncE
MSRRRPGTPEWAPGRTESKRTRLFVAALILLLGAAGVARADSVYISYDGANNTIQDYTSGDISGDSYNGEMFTNTSLAAESGIAFDNQGDLYVANGGNNTITEYNSSGVLIATISSNQLSNPNGLAFDEYGDLFVGNSGNGEVLEFTPSGLASSTPTVYASGLGSPNGLAFDSAGNLYVADNSESIIWEVPASGAAPSEFISPGNYSTINHPRGIAFDSAGNLYVANSDSSVDDIEVFSPAGSPEGVFADSSEGLDTPDGLAFDSSGDLYVVNFSHSGPENETTPGSSSAFEFSPGQFTDGELTGGATLLQAFNDNTQSDLEDGGYIAIENNAGVPLLDPVPEPSEADLVMAGSAAFAGIAWGRRRRG